MTYDPETEPNADESRPVLDLLGEAWDGADWTGEPHIQELIGAAIRNIKNANRWAAFTTPELDWLHLGVDDVDVEACQALAAELAAELERRQP